MLAERLAWLYSMVGTGVLVLFTYEVGAVVAHAKGVFGLLMVMAPCVLFILVMRAVVRAFADPDETREEAAHAAF